MQATNFRNREDRAERWRLDAPSIRSVLLEGKVSAGPVIVREVRREDSWKVTLAENDDVVQALATNRADKSFRVGGGGVIRSGASCVACPAARVTLTA